MGSLRAVVAAALLLTVGAAGAAAPPFRPTGGLAFSAATPVEPAGTSTQPSLALADDGTLWLSATTLGRTAFAHRSRDEARSFRPVSPTGVDPEGATSVAPGDGGAIYAVAPVAGSAVGTAITTDGGATWRQTAFFVPGTLDGRISIVVDRGPTLAEADDTVFLVVHYGGSAYLYSSPGGELAFTNAAGGVAIGTGHCGAVLFNQAQRNLYLPCSAGRSVGMIVGNVPPGQRVGLTFRTFVTPASPGRGSVGAVLPAAAVDQAGTVYAVWVDESDRNVYYAASPDAGRSWQAPVRVNGNEAVTSALPAAVAGAPGYLAIAWLGANSTRRAAAMPPFATSPRVATRFRWYGYGAVVTGAASAAPVVVQRRFTSKPIHFGRIVLGDPSLGEYLGAALDTHGGLVVAYDDTTSQHHAAHLFVTRQVAGPTVLGSSVVEPVDGNPVSDPAGDAPSPQLDLRRVELVQEKPTRLKVRMTVGAPPSAGTPGLWLTRFQVLSTGVRGSAAYRTLYVGARTGVGKAPQLFGGTTKCAERECRSVTYPAVVPASGGIEGDTITVDVALEGGFGAGLPLNGDLLYNVVGLSFEPGKGLTGTDSDSTASFDYRLEERIGRTTGRGRHIVGSGSIRGSGGGRATFKVDVFQAKTGRISFADRRARVAFVSRKITRVKVLGRSKARVWATGAGGATCVATFSDGGTGRRRDTLVISLGRYRRAGPILAGGVTIR